MTLGGEGGLGLMQAGHRHNTDWEGTGPINFWGWQRECRLNEVADDAPHQLTQM